MSLLKLHFLGPPRIERDGRIVDPDTRKATALLAYLALSGERPSRDFLAAFLWPDLDDSHAKAALRRTLSALKSTIGDSAIYATREHIGLESNVVWCDVTQFGQAIKQGDLATAVALYRDDFLSGFSLRDSLPFDDWQRQQSEHLRRELGETLAHLVQNATGAGQFDAARQYAQQWLRLDPLREEVHCQLMRIYTSLGQPNAALRQYRDCVRILDEELGVAPLLETTALYEAIREDRLSTPVVSAQFMPNPHDSAIASGQSSLPFVGRESELDRLRQAYNEVGPDGRFFVVVGEAGVGKTRLVEEFLASSAASNVVSACCYAGETGLAYAPFIAGLRAAAAQPQLVARIQTLPTHWLAEVTRLAPELANGPLPPTSSNSPGAQAHFFEAIAQLMTAATNAPPPGILFLDDLHWADADSLDLLTYLVRRLAGRPLFIVVTWRSESVSVRHRLRALLSESQRAGWGSVIPLSRLGPEPVSALVQAMRADAPAQFGERLYRETEGLPFFVASYLAAMPETGAADWEIPVGVQGLLQTRLTAVSETARQLLQTAAVIGRSFSFDILQAVSGRSEEETVTALEQLIGQGVLMESATGTSLDYDFHHEKMRALVYQETSLARRRLLHRRVAVELAQHHMGSAGQIAHHYQLAGLAAEAAGYYKLAGEAARSVYANVAALAHFQAALAMGHPETAVLHEAVGDLQTLQGEYEAALLAYETAVAQGDEAHLARLEQKLGHVHQRRGEWELAESHFQAALAAVQLPGEHARLLADCSLTAFRRGDQPRALALGKGALTLAETTGDTAALMQALNVLGMLARVQVDLVGARHYLERSFSLAEKEGEVAQQIAVLNNLALVEAAAGNTDKALVCFQQALRLCQTFGDRHHEAALHNNLADLYHQMGQREAAMVALKTAVSIYADIGDQRNNWLPEIWKLTAW